MGRRRIRWLLYYEKLHYGSWWQWPVHLTAIGDALIDDDYTINADGLAYGRGLAAALGSDGKDVDGNDFDGSNPNIGCYATVASGWTAGSCAGVAFGNITSVDGVAKSAIASINGV